MVFNSLEFAIFFPIIFLLYWALRQQHTARTLLVVLGSAFFYTRFDYGPKYQVKAFAMTWHWLGAIYLGVLFVSAVIDFVLARAIHRIDEDTRYAGLSQAERDKKRKRLMIISVIYNLGVLAFFKYTNFGADTVAQLFHVFGIELKRHLLSVVLPIGISFFTFETMSYTIDVYRRELVPAKSLLEYMLFISFFPHLVAGPIIRPKDMLPQLRANPVLRDKQISDGLFLIFGGLLKKVIIADYLAVNHVDRVFDRPEWFSAPEVLAAVYGYALQIYCDFSGYTDIAIGVSFMLGIVLPKNFDSPYTSVNLQDFWRRWHISLSSWLRDYLYISLGGSRGSAWKTYRNLMLTMLLGGLWHGASWNFVVWGALHGAALAVTRMWQRFWESRNKAKNIVAKPSLFKHGLAVIATFHYVCLAWIFFRADGFGRAWAMIRQIGRGSWHVTNLSRNVLLVMALGFVTHFFPDRWLERIRNVFGALPAPAQAVVGYAVFVAVKEIATSQVIPYIYFQF